MIPLLNLSKILRYSLQSTEPLSNVSNARFAITLTCLEVSRQGRYESLLLAVRTGPAKNGRNVHALHNINLNLLSSVLLL